MNLTKLASGWGMVLALFGSLVLMGCGSMPTDQSETPLHSSNLAGPPIIAPADVDGGAGADYLRPGQKITVEFSDAPGVPPAITQTIREDGYIGLPFGVNIKAGGLNRGQLIDQIQKAYVPNFYQRLSVNIKNDELYFSVGGEVKMPAQRPYLGQTTVLQAIQSAGDFTDFAQKKHIEVTRANGKKYVVNGLKAAQDRTLDIPVYPGDRIIVPRRIF